MKMWGYMPVIPTLGRRIQKIELILLRESGELPKDVRGMGRYLAILLTTCVGDRRAGPEVLRVEELFLPLTSYSTWESVLSTSPGPLGVDVS